MSRKVVSLLILVLPLVPATAQHKPLRMYTPLAPEETTLMPVIDSVAIIADTNRNAVDTLAWSQLRLLTGYAQLDRLIQQLPVTAVGLDQLPSILPVALPLNAFRISSAFGMRRHPVLNRARLHGGVDVKAPLRMVVKATAPGRVLRVGYDAELGAYVRISHAFGFETIYGHLSGYCVRPGDVVGRHQQIGLVGNSGLTTGPHLHYVIKKNGSIVDPYHFCFLFRRRLYMAQRVSPAAIGASSAVSKTASSVR